ncbi:MAG: 50S ribosomal protein L18 [Deltaproteobacteria bacterium]|nr:50S ribosomal protein L18 [Deltaproteobacteria bacterium]MBW2175453.1 50S ribosomal protein L18 [Deltaproteobacteria bacterium]
MGSTNLRKVSRLKRKKSIRKRLSGTAERPRLSVFRSSRHIYAQLVDDVKGGTLVSAGSLEKDVRDTPKFESKVAMAEHIGKLLAERAKEKGIEAVVFDRNGFLYHGRVKALSSGARKAGLKF